MNSQTSKIYVSKGHLTTTDKRNIKAIIKAARTDGRLSNKNYFLSLEGGVYTCRIQEKIEGKVCDFLVKFTIKLTGTAKAAKLTKKDLSPTGETSYLADCRTFSKGLTLAIIDLQIGAFTKKKSYVGGLGYVLYIYDNQNNIIAKAYKSDNQKDDGLIQVDVKNKK